MKKFVKEFKEFALKGNMIDLAIGIIIGGAFNSIVSSLVNDIINPVLGIFGNTDLSNLFVSLDGNQYATIAAAEEAGGNILKYGSFVSNIINFLVMAFVVFLMVKLINKLKAPKKEAVTTKDCPYCQSKISIKATKCPHCTSDLS